MCWATSAARPTYQTETGTEPAPEDHKQRERTANLLAHGTNEITDREEISQNHLQEKWKKLPEEKEKL